MSAYVYKIYISTYDIGSYRKNDDGSSCIHIDADWVSFDTKTKPYLTYFLLAASCFLDFQPSTKLCTGLQQPVVLGPHVILHTGALMKAIEKPLLLAEIPGHVTSPEPKVGV